MKYRVSTMKVIWCESSEYQQRMKTTKAILSDLSEVENLWYKRPSDSEIAQLCWLLLSLSEAELKRIDRGNEFPMIMKIIASRLLSNRGFETVEKILDRIYGKTILQKWTDDNIVSIIISSIQNEQDNNLTEGQKQETSRTVPQEEESPYNYSITTLTYARKLQMKAKHKWLCS